jgi:hypothetical protein
MTAMTVEGRRLVLQGAEKRSGTASFSTMPRTLPASPRVGLLVVLAMAVGVICVNLLSLWVLVLPNSTTFALLAAAAGQTLNASACREDLSADLQVDATAKASPIRISYRLVYGQPYRGTYNKYSCAGMPNVTTVLPKELQGHGVVDFLTEVSTDLRIAVVGDSVGMQVAQAFEEALGSDVRHRTVYEQTHRENLVVSYPVRGGGAIISFRVNGMLWRDVEAVRRRLLRRQRQHRRLKDVLVPQPWNRSKIQAVLSRPMIPIENVDVLVQRITYPWTPLQNITHESLEGNTRVASQVFGMRTLIFVNMHFCNNVADQATYREFMKKREVVRSFARNYVPSSLNGAVRRVLVLDLDALADRLNECNARSLGFDTANTPFEEWMLGNWLGPIANESSGGDGTEEGRAKQHHYIGQVCAERVPHGSEFCLRSRVFLDGMHICPNTFAGRVNAGLACLIECAQVDDNREASRQDGVSFSDQGRSELRACEIRCNERFMSLIPIPEAKVAS